MVSIGFETLNGPLWSPCGGFYWDVRYHITTSSGINTQPLSRSSSSWIVQKVHRIVNVYECNNNSPTEVDLITPLSDDSIYWELFRIELDGSSFRVSTKFDFDRDVHGVKEGITGPDTWNQPVLGHRGNYRISAWAYWMPDAPSGFVVGDEPLASRAPSKADDANPIGLPGHTLYRSALAEWDCCNGRNIITGVANALNIWDSYIERWSADGENDYKKVNGESIPH